MKLVISDDAFSAFRFIRLFETIDYYKFICKFASKKCYIIGDCITCLCEYIDFEDTQFKNVLKTNSVTEVYLTVSNLSTTVTNIQSLNFNDVKTWNNEDMLEKINLLRKKYNIKNVDLEFFTLGYPNYLEVND